jgi:hypothetical protein
MSMFVHRKFLSASENAGKSSADSNFSIANLFINETQGIYVLLSFSILKHNKIKS